VEVIHGEHDAEIAQGIDRGVPVVRDDGRREEAGELEPAVAVRRSHHGNLDTMLAQPGDASGPFAFDHGPPFKLEAEFAKEINRPVEVFDDDSHVVHPLERHVSSLQSVVPIYKGKNGGFYKMITPPLPDRDHGYLAAVIRLAALAGAP